MEWPVSHLAVGDLKILANALVLTCGFHCWDLLCRLQEEIHQNETNLLFPVPGVLEM